MSEFVHHEPCPQCGSRDNLGRFDDGHGYCFGCQYYEPGDDDPPDTSRSEESLVSRHGMVEGEIQALTKRGISEETCRKFGYEVGHFKGKPAQIANYRPLDGGPVVGQKIRLKDKGFPWTGDAKKASPLWGSWLWRSEGKMVVITEGEIDAMTVSQIQGNKWPVVSIKDGAQSAAKSISRALDWLESFERVVFMFDMDDAGQKAAQEAAMCLSPGVARIANLPLKDPNEMFQAGRGREIIDAIWNARTFRPDGIVTLSEVKDLASQDVTQGLPWWSKTLTDLTYGRRKGEAYAFGAGTGVGKTDFLTQQVVYDVMELQEPVGLFFLEQQPAETAKRIAGKSAGKRFHVPDGTWTHEELLQALDNLERSGRLYLYNHFGSCDWDVIEKRIRYLARGEGVRLFYLDHLTALVSGTDNERVELEKVMSEIGSLVKELDVIIHYVSHLATPEGKPHEEGGRVMIRHFKGSRAIGYWSHYMFGLERDQQDDESNHETSFRILKDRYTGQATGEVIPIGYDHDTGRLYELDGSEYFDKETSDDQQSPF